MQPPSWYFHRLRSMDAGEVIWRIRSVLNGQVDRVRYSLGFLPRLPSEDLIWSGAADNIFGFSTLAGDIDWKTGVEPFAGWSSRLCQKADQIMEDKLSFFDLEQQYLGDPIDWHRDWSAGKTAPLKLSTRIDYRDFRKVGDCKLVWEPNRHHQLVVLARAYKVTGQIKYAAKVVSLLLNWIAANPVGYGMNWKSPLELGIRLINWIWAIDLIRHSGAIDSNSWASIVDSIYVAIWDVQRKFSEGSSANNHLIGEAAGVFIATSYLPYLPNVAEWNDKSRRVLENEILNQTFTDGCTREHAFGYQLFVIQFLSLSSILAERRSKPFSDEYLVRLHKMYNFIADISSDTGKQPNMGDADNGYVLDLGELPDQPDELISVGGHLFSDSSLVSENDSETAYWLFGESCFNRRRELNDTVCRAYPESGYYILRSRPSRVASERRLSVVFDCAELGYGNIAAHGHADCLSFTLNVGQLEVLVDPGTYDYFSYPEWRQYFRMTRAHNTVTVDDMCQSTSLGPFLWGSRANAKLLSWLDSPTESEVSGQHDGYARLPDPVIHSRTIRLDIAKSLLNIHDRFECQSRHQIRRYFHLAPGCSVEHAGDQAVKISRSDFEIYLTADNGTMEIVPANDDRGLGWVSSSYHRKARSNCIVITNEIDGATTISAELLLS